MSLIWGSGGNPTSKAGNGIVSFTSGSSVEGTSGNRFNIFSGTIRSNSTSVPWTTAVGVSIIALRGGVFEINGGSNGTGTSADFTRTLGTGNGNINWQTGATGDAGNGGFSAFSSAASVNLGGSATPAQVIWNDGASFVQNGFALLFGSTKSDARLTFLNSIALDPGSNTNYNAREIYVFDNTGTSNDKTRLAGVISGAVNTDLLKTGAGELELSATNTYLGNTLIQGGTLTCVNASVLPTTTNVYVMGGTLNLSAAQTITDLVLESGATLALGSNNLTVKGNFTNKGGTITGTGAIILAAGSSSITQNIDGSSPATISGGLTLNNSAGASLANSITINGTYTTTSGKLSIASNTLTLAGTVSGMSANNSFIGSNTSKLTLTNSGSIGTLYFDQGTSADVTTVTGSNALQNLVVSGGGSVTLGNKVNLFNRLSVSSGTLATGGNLVLRSTSSNTAYVDQVGGTISGQVTVERYIHKQGRGWRALTAPITYNGITQGYVSGNWQSDFGYSNNYGTRITGPDTLTAGNGIDNYSNNASLQTYNTTTGAWTKVINTNTQTQSGNSATAANKGFFVFVRGDRTVLPTNGGAGVQPNNFVSTTLASKGLLQTGTQTFNFTGTSGKSWLLGNPYACPVDMSTVNFSGSISKHIYVWEPGLTGSSANTNGNYSTFDTAQWAAGSTGTLSTQYFQSGQAFFVTTNSGSASITFHETDKISGRSCLKLFYDNKIK